MGIVVRLPVRRHARASSKTKALIGTVPPENSLSRLAIRKEASRRPARMLRMWDSEQPAASARSATVLPFSSAQRSIGCESLMAESISPGNDSRQAGIFLTETAIAASGVLKCHMAKQDDEEPPHIYLGQWLDFFEKDITEAAEEAGCTQSYVSNIIANRKPNVNVLYLLRISEWLDVNINDFYRPLPRKSELQALKKLSPRAQAAILEKQRKQA